MKFYLCLVFFITCSFSNLATSYSVSQNDKYPHFCKLASEDDSVFKTFRREYAYREIVETVGNESGKLFLDEINQRYPYLLPYFTKICAEDIIGEPLGYFYPQIGKISPTVLRYIKIVGDLQKEFGDLSDLCIAEIGGGFGGQCKIINDINGFKTYDIIDLPECTPLISKFLSHFQIKNVKTIDCNSFSESKKYDLVISNYAFSEINREEQARYMELIINQAPCGYFIYNHFPNVNPFSLNEFIELLKAQGRTVKVITEDPSRTGDIVIWHS